jgi:type I restriction enzyme S subunit
VKGNAETVIEQIDLLKKSILAKAFRGELGTNDPGEESAVELLKKAL